MKEDTLFWVEETDEQFSLPIKRKRTNKAKKLEFIGWGSRPLIEFLDSIGIEATKQLAQKEVTSIINQYVNANNLLNPLKKKKVLCDDRLHALFGKKSVPRMKIYDLLEVHFAENHDDSEDESYSSEEEDDIIASYKEKRTKTSGIKLSHGKKDVHETPKSCFAAVIPENIKLVYLKRSLVQELLKIQESFEEQVKGSFVRVKSDPNDYLQKHSHQLQQVTGTRKISKAGNDGTEILLQVTNSATDIPLRMLSDDNFSEEECEDLRERVKAGLIERPTVVELDAKAKVLHEDIMKHWIAREIASLQRLIDRANEKGLRRDLYDYLERKKLLQTDSEQKRLLVEMPKVIPDELELQPTSIDTSIGAEENNSSPKSILRGASDTCSADAAENRPIQPDKEGPEDRPIQQDRELPAVSIYEIKREERQEENPGGRGNSQQMLERQVIPGQRIENSQGMLERQVIPSQAIENLQGTSERKVMPNYVIELSDDEVETPVNRVRNTDEDPLDAIWHYMDPQGEIQGPFTIMALKRWNNLNYFTPGFKVWKTGQSQEQAVLLVDVIRRIFPAG